MLACLPAYLPAYLQLTFEFSLCLSRACLGKMFVNIYIYWLKADRFQILQTNRLVILLRTLHLLCCCSSSDSRHGRSSRGKGQPTSPQDCGDSPSSETKRART